MSARVIQGEDEESDIVYSAYEDEIVEEYEEEEYDENETTLYELYDDDLAATIQDEADSIFFAESEEIAPTKANDSAVDHSSSALTKTKPQKQPPLPKVDIPPIVSKAQNHLKTFHAEHNNFTRPHVVEIGASIRNTRATALAATTQSRRTKEELAAWNKSISGLTQDLVGVLDTASWLDRFVIIAHDSSNPNEIASK